MHRLPAAQASALTEAWGSGAPASANGFPGLGDWGSCLVAPDAPRVLTRTARRELISATEDLIWTTDSPVRIVLGSGLAVRVRQIHAANHPKASRFIARSPCNQLSNNRSVVRHSAMHGESSCCGVCVPNPGSATASWHHRHHHRERRAPISLQMSLFPRAHPEGMNEPRLQIVHAGCMAGSERMPHVVELGEPRASMYSFDKGYDSPRMRRCSVQKPE